MSELYKGLVWVTVGLLLMIMLMTFGAAIVGYRALRVAAEAAAWSGQTALHQEVTSATGNQGYFLTSLKQTSDPVQAANTQWQTSASEMHLSTMFSNLQESASVSNNQVTVTASGVFHVPWLDTASRVLFRGQWAVTFQVPMQVTVVGAS